MRVSFNTKESSVAHFDMPQIKMRSMSESYTDAVVEKIRGIEENLKPDEVLNVYCETADGRMRVGSLQFTSSMVVLAHGVDDHNVPTCLISSSSALQLTCKITKSESNTKKATIGFSFPPTD